MSSVSFSIAEMRVKAQICSYYSCYIEESHREIACQVPLLVPQRHVSMPTYVQVTRAISSIAVNLKLPIF